MGNTMLSKDTRLIYALVLEGVSYWVGSDNVTRISAVDENGEMAHVPWFEVWRGEKLHARVNAAYVSEVYYQKGQPDPNQF